MECKLAVILAAFEIINTGDHVSQSGFCQGQDYDNASQSGFHHGQDHDDCVTSLLSWAGP